MTQKSGMLTLIYNVHKTVVLFVKWLYICTPVSSEEDSAHLDSARGDAVIAQYINTIDPSRNRGGYFVKIDRAITQQQAEQENQITHFLLNYFL